MNGRKSKRGMRRQPIIQKKVIRCSLHQKPVFTSEMCSDFVPNKTSEGEHNCKNCHHAF